MPRVDVGQHSEIAVAGEMTIPELPTLRLSAFNVAEVGSPGRSLVLPEQPRDSLVLVNPAAFVLDWGLLATALARQIRSR
jgi:hypothetical protein